MIEFEYRNLDSSFSCAGEAVIKLVFADGVFPDTKSKVYVDRISTGCSMLVANQKEQIIQVLSPPDLSWEFIYNYSHELGHLATRADTRVSESGTWVPGSHPWIEEALCCACSVFVTEQIVKAPKFASEIVTDCTDHIRNNYSGFDIYPRWYSQNAASLKDATGANPLTRKLGGWIAARFPAGAFLSDNRVLTTVPLNPKLHEYLNQWSSQCARPHNVADAFRELIGSA